MKEQRVDKNTSKIDQDKRNGKAADLSALDCRRVARMVDVSIVSSSLGLGLKDNMFAP
jgi:hypothetical protein